MQKPGTLKGYYDGSLWTNLESPREFIPADMTPNQVREINAYTNIENELIDDACGRVFAWLKAQDMFDNTDIFFTTDHGELQGDFGLMFKGPYHVDALMRLPFIWRPAKAANVAPAEVLEPVGHLDLAATFCAIAGVEPPSYNEGKALPVHNEEAKTQGRDYVLTEWDSEHGPADMHLRSIYHRDGWLCTPYGKSFMYDGTEGELYDMNNDPLQKVNLGGQRLQTKRDELTEQLEAALPKARSPRFDRKAPVLICLALTERRETHFHRGHDIWVLIAKILPVFEQGT